MKSIIGRFALLLLPLMLLSGLQAQDKLWEKSLKDAMTWNKITDYGTLLVGTRNSVHSFDPDTGEEMWAKKDMRRTAPFNFRTIAGTPILLYNDHGGATSRKSRLYAFNIMDGSVIWETPEIQGFSIGAYPIYEKNLVVVFTNKHEKEGGYGTWVVGMDLETGEQKFNAMYNKGARLTLYPADLTGSFWVKTDLSGHPEPIVDGDTLYVSFNGIGAIDLNNGELLWEHKFKVGNTGHKFDHATVLEGDTLYSSGTNYVIAVDKNTGEKKWENKKVKSKHIVDLLPTSETLVVRYGGLFYNRSSKKNDLDKRMAVVGLDKNTGSQKWLFKDIRDGITNLALLPDGKTLFFGEQQQLHGVDVETGKSTFTVDLEFKRSMGATDVAAGGMKVGFGALQGGLLGGLKGAASAAGGTKLSDIPVQVTVSEDGKVTVRGQQHLALFNPQNQETEWSAHIAAPGTNPITLVAAGALMSATSLGYSAQYHTSYSAAARAQNSMFKGLDGFQEMVNRRYTATQNSQNWTYFLTSVKNGKKGGPGILAIDMITGEQGTEIFLGEKEPKYRVDEPTGKVFFFAKKGKLLQAFQM